MHPRERGIIYSMLGLLTVCTGALLMERGGTPALADARWADDLGPADALRLSGDPELALRNADGRVSWSDTEYARAYAIAFVDVNKVLDGLMETSVYKDEREALTERLNAEELDWKSKFDGLDAEFEGVAQDDPRLEDGRNRFRELNVGFQQWREGAQEQVNAMAVKQLERAYREVIDAVNIVADERAIDIVYRFTPVAEPLPEGLSGQTMLDIRMRPVLRAPDGLDITAHVLQEMAITSE